MAFDMNSIGTGMQGILGSVMIWVKVFGFIFAFALIAATVLIIVWYMKRYPYRAVVLDIDKEGKIRNIIAKAKAGRVRRKTADGTSDYFVLKIQKQNIVFNSPALVEEIFRGGSVGTLLLARYENDVVMPIISERVNQNEVKLRVISKEIAMQQMLTGRDIDELTKIKKNMLLTIAPYMIIVVGFMIVGFFLLALLQQIGLLIEKIPTSLPAPVPVVTAGAPAG